MPSPFDVLGVEPDADEEAVVQAYRRRVLEAHPDHGGSASEFQAVRTAYERIRAGDAGPGATGGPGPGAAGESGSGPVEERPERTPSRVEYLNYEVLDDYGWSLDDEGLFGQASAADLDPVDYGAFLVQPGESLLEAAENRGFAWPFACRGGACANCAVAVVQGELSQPVDHILPDEMVDRGIRLSCNARPLTDDLQVVYNLKWRPDLDDLRLPPTRFERAHADD